MNYVQTTWRVLITVAVATTGLTGCVTATVEQIRETTTAMNEGDSIVVLGRRNRPSQAEAELDFIDCVSRKVAGGSNGVEVITEQEFVDAMFPWFEPRTAPLNTNELPELL
ncbi:MAG: hypothetical protein AAF993_20820, partial [Pseudomonadota bacterium]